MPAWLINSCRFSIDFCRRFVDSIMYYTTAPILLTHLHGGELPHTHRQDAQSDGKWMRISHCVALSLAVRNGVLHIELNGQSQHTLAHEYLCILFVIGMEMCTESKSLARNNVSLGDCLVVHTLTAHNMTWIRFTAFFDLLRFVDANQHDNSHRISLDCSLTICQGNNKFTESQYQLSECSFVRCFRLLLLFSSHFLFSCVDFPMDDDDEISE